MAKGKPKDWPPPRAKWPPRCTPTRDGWVRWYKGRTRFVCGKLTPIGEVEDRWIEKKRAIDKGDTQIADAERIAAAGPTVRTYRQVLSEYLAVQESRVGAARNGIERRTLDNYAAALNGFGAFPVDGVTVADMDVRDIGPGVFSAYARTFRAWKASGFDSVVSRVGALFRWADGQEYIDRYRPGPEFVRPGKGAIRSERIELAKSFTAVEVATLYLAANHTVRCWTALGVCAAFNNSDVAHVTRTVLAGGVVDFRRRKQGKVRRVIPLPADVVTLLGQYVRPEPGPGVDADLFFLTERAGQSYSRTSGDGPSCSISRLYAKLMKGCGMETGKGRNFSGLRTTFRNLSPHGGYDHERELVMGHARGDIDTDHYLEWVDLERLSFVVEHVWSQVRSEIEKQRQAAVSTSPAGAAVP